MYSIVIREVYSIMKKVNTYLSNCYNRGFTAVLESKSGKGFRAFSRNEGGYMAGNAIGILVLLVTLMLCALLFGTLQGQTDSKIAVLQSEEANASYANIKTTGWGSIDLFGMVPYVAVFIVILGMLMGLTRESR